jgi:hypothetical protein
LCEATLRNEQWQDILPMQFRTQIIPDVLSSTLREIKLLAGDMGSSEVRQ